MTPPLSAVAISQSTVNNNQVQLGDIFATQTLNVVDVSDSTSATTSSTGNGVTSAVVSGSLDVQSTQQLSGNVNAVTHLSVDTNAGAQTTVVTAATGNTSEADSIQGGGPLTGNFTQNVDPVTIKSENDFNAANAQTGGASVSSQAIANSMGFSVQDTTSNITTSQSTAATVDAESGSEVGGGSGATLLGTSGTAAFSTTAVGNNLSSDGSGVASQTINATQTVTGDLTQAGQFVNVGTAQTIQGDATATANNLSATNTGGTLDVTSNQSNSSFTFADSLASAYEFGTGQATAFGVGNSVLAGNVGPQTNLANTQVNTGGTEAQASFSGNDGFDATASATAMGNAVTAFACSQCGGTINISNSQLSSGGVQASSTIAIAASNRSVNGVSTAVGNNATFYVSKPGG
jgi:hypothetical protein